MPRRGYDSDIDEYIPRETYPPRQHRHAARKPHHHHQGHPSEPGHPIAEDLPLGMVAIQTPKLEPQPWVRDLWRWLATNTQGSARIDLRRPVPPRLDPHRDNLLFTSHKASSRAQRSQQHIQSTGAAGIRQHRGVHAYVHDYSDGPPPPPQQEQPPPAAASGMRLKVTRHMRFFQDPEGLAKPWLDLGLGFNLDMDRQQLQPVARLKLKDVLSLKVAPEPLVKLAHSVPLPGVGMVVKLLYELPLRHAHRFWQPPARLMLRLDSVPGSGFHITPAGVEFAGRADLGRNLALIGAGGVSFPRQIPFDMDDPQTKLQVHRLTVKSRW